MTPRIRSERLANLMHFGAFAADTVAFYPLNQFTRAGYRWLLLPLIERILGQSIKSHELKVFPRHSVQLPRDFNMFLSDLDLAIVLDREAESAQIRPLLDLYGKFGNAVPSLGELEIYTEEEWRERRRIFETSGSWIELIWNLRKWVWQFKAYQEAPTPYHRRKAERAIAKIRHKLAAPTGSLNPRETRLIQVLDPWLRGPFREGPEIDGTSEYLGWELKGVPLGFGCILPDAEFFLDNSVPRILELRQNPELSRATASVAAWERLLCQSRGRLFSTVYDANWQAHLSYLSRRYGGV